MSDPTKLQLEEIAIRAEEWLHEYRTHSLTDGDNFRLYEALRDADCLPPDVKAEHAAPDLLAALERMDALVESLWKSVPWGNTFDLDIQALNEAPLQAKRAIAKARGEQP